MRSNVRIIEKLACFNVYRVADLRQYEKEDESAISFRASIVTRRRRC